MGLESMKRYENGSSDYYKKELDAIPALKSKEAAVLIEKIKNGDSSAKERFVLAKLSFVADFVTKIFSDIDVSMEDLIQEGNISLLAAIDNYNPKKGISFANYAATCIYHHILRYFSDNALLIQLPVLKSQLVYKVMKYKNQYKANTGFYPTPEELCNQLDISMDSYHYLQKYVDILNFEEVLFMEEKNYDRINDCVNKTVEDVVFEQIMKNDVHRLVDKNLSSCEKDIIFQSLGINDEFSSLRSLGEKYGLAHTTIAQRKNKALQHLKKMALQEEINAYLTDDVVNFKIMKKK